MARQLIGEVKLDDAGCGARLSLRSRRLDQRGVCLTPMVPTRPQLSSNPLTGLGPIANHSWVADFEEPESVLEVLHRFDWLVDIDNMVNVVGVSTAKPVASNAFNVISVRNTLWQIPDASIPLDNVYVSNRVAALLVAPLPNPSRATALVSSASILLLDTIYPKSVPAEVLKAALLAGADRVVEQNSDGSSILNYRGRADWQAANGLDFRYGAGQLNIEKSYEIFTAPSVRSMEDGGAGITQSGYGYDDKFGGLNGSNRTASYRFETKSQAQRLTASLVWNIHIEDQTSPFQPDPTLVDLDLVLYELTQAGRVEYLASRSTIDNTENIWIELPPGKLFELRVETKEPGLFEWDYALAWHLQSTQTSVQVPMLGSKVGILLLMLSVLCIGVTARAIRN